MNDTIKLVIEGQRTTLHLTDNDHGLRKTWEGRFSGGKVTVIETYYDKGGMDAVRYSLEVTRSFSPVGKPGFHLESTLKQATDFFGLSMTVDQESGSPSEVAEEESPF